MIGRSLRTGKRLQWSKAIGDMQMLKEIANKIGKRAYHEMMLRGYFRKVWYPKYQFQYFPRQLCFLAGCIEKTSKVEGAIVEISARMVLRRRSYMSIC